MNIECRRIVTRVLSPDIYSIERIVILQIYITCYAHEVSICLVDMRNNSECWTGAPFEPYQYVAILIVDSVHSVVRVNEDSLWIQTEGVVVGKSGAVVAPRGVGAELRLIE